jgi:hypothetical protein
VLRLLIEDTGHARKKCKEFLELELFLHSRQSTCLQKASVLQATPDDIVDFLIHRDLLGNGRTVVHAVICLSRPMDGSCGCPIRLAAESVRGVASQLRTRFFEIGCGGAWVAESCSGNPVASKKVDHYVKAIREEQARAGCQVTMARHRAMLPMKLASLISAMAKEADRLLRSDTSKYLQTMQDMAWLCIQFRAINRGADIASLKVGNTLLGPNASCLVLQFTFSKTMRDGSSHEFAVAARPGDPTCPVRRFMNYVNMTKRLRHWTWKDYGAFVFQDLTSETPKAVTAAAMAKRLKKHLIAHDLDDNEILHGLRAGGALAMALEGKSLKDIMAQGFWASPSTALRYVGLLSEIIGPEFLDEVRRRHGDLLDQFHLHTTDHIPSLGDV